VTRAAPILPCPAGRTGLTGLEHLDGHPVAGGHTPTLCRSGADGVDGSDGLVTRNERKPARELAGVLLMVGPAQRAGRNPNQRIVVAEVRERKLPDDQAARRFQHQRPRHRAVRHIGTLKSS
jgi:hypothetical protein